jgi:sialate O-acetylesterase
MKLLDKTLSLLALCALAICGQTHAAEPALSLVNSQGKSMVLQRDMPAPVWGRAPAKTEVTVSFQGQTKKAVADAEGRWLVTLEPLKADSAAASLSVSGGGPRVLRGHQPVCLQHIDLPETFGRQARP